MTSVTCPNCGDEEVDLGGPGCEYCNYTGLNPEYGCYFGPDCPNEKIDGITMDGGFIFPAHRSCHEVYCKYHNAKPGQLAKTREEWMVSTVPFWRDWKTADKWIKDHFNENGEWK